MRFSSPAAASVAAGFFSSAIPLHMEPRMSRTLPSMLLAVAFATPCIASAALTPEQARAREIYDTLIAYDTSAGHGQVPVMAKYLVQQFRAAGFPDADIHLLPVDDTASLVVRLRGDGSGGKPILLMAHMDVVAADPNDWKRDPFTLIEENGYFFGRGTSDVKDGIATLTHTFLRMKREGFVPTRDLVIVFTGDEETEMATTRDLVDNHRDLIDADYALNYDGGGGTLVEDGTARVTASITSARSGEASLAVGSSMVVTATFAPTTSCSVLRTSSIATPGKIRQLTFAVADCGNAFFAWPPRSIGFRFSQEF